MRITGTQNTRSDEQLSEFENYLEDRKRMTGASLSVIEEVGTKAALNRCRALAQRIQCDLRNKKPEHFADVWALADFQVALTLRPSRPRERGRSRNEIAEIIGVTTGALHSLTRTDAPLIDAEILFRQPGPP